MDAPTTTTPPVHTSALVREHRPQPPAPHIHCIGQHQVRLQRIAVIDFYPATTNPERTPA